MQEGTKEGQRGKKAGVMWSEKEREETKRNEGWGAAGEMAREKGGQGWRDDNAMWPS